MVQVRCKQHLYQHVVLWALVLMLAAGLNSSQIGMGGGLYGAGEGEQACAKGAGLLTHDVDHCLLKLCKRGS
jgi:hypothetical protein